MSCAATQEVPEPTVGSPRTGAKGEVVDLFALDMAALDGGGWVRILGALAAPPNLPLLSTGMGKSSLLLSFAGNISGNNCPADVPTPQPST